MNLEYHATDEDVTSRFGSGVTVVDFGGGEMPYSPGAIVVDKMSQEEFRAQGYENTYVEADLFDTKLFGLAIPQANVLVIYRLARYCLGGWEFPSRAALFNLAGNIHLHTAPRACVIMLDFMEVLEPVLEELDFWGYDVTRLSLVVPREDDLPAEWLVKLLAPA
jgi:hypothetical protein